MTVPPRTRYWKGGPIPLPADARLRRNMQVNAETGCWEWTSSLALTGYGTVRYLGRSRQAHRLAFITWVGEIEPGLCVCHRCDNRRCINPDHLFLGTKSDNTQDAVKKGRHYSHYRGRPTCNRGHPYTPENTHLSKGKRLCRACARLRMAACRARAREQESANASLM